MNISNITPPQVWTSSSRSLTNIGSGAIAPTSTITTSIAGASVVDLRPSAGTMANSTITVSTGVGATAVIGIQAFDGTTATVIVNTAGAASSPASASSFQTSTVGVRIQNTDATHAGTYIVAQFTWTQ